MAEWSMAANILESRWRPVRLVYQEAFRSLGKALREFVLKQLSHAPKEALVVSARRRSLEPESRCAPESEERSL
jgi:predicted GIY-YIG superfamily endonuclease